MAVGAGAGAPGWPKSAIDLSAASRTLSASSWNFETPAALVLWIEPWPMRELHRAVERRARQALVPGQMLPAADDVFEARRGEVRVLQIVDRVIRGVFRGAEVVGVDRFLRERDGLVERRGLILGLVEVLAHGLRRLRADRIGEACLGRSGRQCRPNRDQPDAECEPETLHEGGLLHQLAVPFNARARAQWAVADGAGEAGAPAAGALRSDNDLTAASRTLSASSWKRERLSAPALCSEPLPMFTSFER